MAVVHTEDPGNGKVRLVPVIAAFRAAEAAQMRIGMIIVFVFRLAVDAVTGIREGRGNRLERGGGIHTVPENRVGEAVVGERSGQGAICIQAELCPGDIADSLANV